MNYNFPKKRIKIKKDKKVTYDPAHLHFKNAYKFINIPTHNWRKVKLIYQNVSLMFVSKFRTPVFGWLMRKKFGRVLSSRRIIPMEMNYKSYTKMEK